MRIGPKMQAVASYVATNPGRYMKAAAEHVAPHGRGIGYGYKTVHRALQAGLVAKVPGPRKGTYMLVPVNAP